MVILVSLACLSASAEEAAVWVEDSFDAFADGTLDASGQNVYVSRDGSVRTIQRFDIDDDGHVDLFFGNTHNHINRVDPTACTVGPDRSLSSQPMPVPGSNQVSRADLNGDGWTDLVFTLDESGLQHGRVMMWILYGGEDGWTVRRSSVLPTNAPLAHVVADLNGDGWPEIVVLNRSDGPIEKGKNIRIYWGADTGFLLSQYQDVGLVGARELRAADFDGDGAADLVAMAPGSVRVFWGRRTGVDRIHELTDGMQAGIFGASTDGVAIPLDSEDIELPDGGAVCVAVADTDGDGQRDLVLGAGGDTLLTIPGKAKRRWGKIEAVPGPAVSDISVGDLDGDGHEDFVFANLPVRGRFATAGGEPGGVDTASLSPVQVYWGGADGVDWKNATVLDCRFASATDVGDLDGDGHLDIAVAVYQDLADVIFDAESFIYFGNGGRAFERAETAIPTSGTTDVVVVPGEHGQSGRAIFANRLKGILYERVPVYVYWGQAEGFDAAKRWAIPGQSGHEATGADYNADGYVDLAMTFTAHGGPAALKNPIIGTNILWGSASGYDLDNRRTILPEPYMDTSTTADLNKDGYLDMVLGGWEQWYGEGDDTEARVGIYYGSAMGFQESDRVYLRSEGRSNGVSVADFNKDGWLDISATSRVDSKVRIFWGSAEGFDENRQKWLAVPIAMGTEIADFNADGWLDLIVSSYRDYVGVYNDTGNVVFWGGPEGFQHWNAQWLPGSCTHYQAVADYDGDGYLDVFVPNYHDQYRRGAIPSYLFWGGPEGFDIDRKTDLICDSACGAQAGDFNEDGLIDLAVACHSANGSHQVNSKVFYNDGARFTDPNITDLPTEGAHMMWIQDMGHIYDRSYRQTYESSVYTWDKPMAKAAVAWEATVPERASLAFEVRSAQEESALPEAAWRAATENQFALDESDRAIQYRAIFTSENGDRYPVLESVRVAFSGE